VSTAATKTVPPAPAAKRPAKPILLDRLINLSYATGEPRQVCIENDRDPDEVLQDATYWQTIGPALSVGTKLELTNDCGSFLWEL
jgi:hypothetical protein